VNRKPFLNLNNKRFKVQWWNKSISGTNKSIYFADREQISNSTHTSWILCSRNAKQYYPAKTVWSKL